MAANHVSNWDPILVGVAINRPVHFMAKAELFHNPLLGTILRGLNAFPVNRGSADRNAIRQALELLEKGETLEIFPPGRRGARTLLKAAFSQGGDAGYEKQGGSSTGSSYRYKRGIPFGLDQAITGNNRQTP